MLTQGAGGRALPDPRPYGRGDFMSTYEEFMVIIAIAGLIVSILNLTHKK